MKEIVEKWLSITQNTSSYLSPHVQELVLEKGITTVLSDDQNNLTLADLLDINTNLSSILMNDDGYLLHPTERSREWYMQHIQDVAPYFCQVYIRMKTISDKEKHDLIELCSWMHQPEVVSLCFDLLANKENETLNSHECLLLITATLERALGNLFLFGAGGKKRVPSLLRDLLASKELSLLLGESQVILLQLLLGSPMSLNLRNLIWHGFAVGLELDRYASVLVLVCAAIGRSITAIVNEITTLRCWATFKLLPTEWSEFLNEKMLVDAVSRGEFIPASSRKAIWHRAILYHQSGLYGRCSALIIPEIEHTLRLIYCAANDCPARTLTAESVVHYTTLDVILLASNSNRIVDYLGSSLFSALKDVFVELEGPRIRDRLSHGECNLFDIDVTISRHLLALSGALLGNPIPPYSPHYTLPVVFDRQLVVTIETVGKWLQQTVHCKDNDPIDLTWPPLLNDWLANHLLIDHEEGIERRDPKDAPTWRHLMSQLLVGCQRMTAYRSSTLSSLRSRQRSTQARLDSYMSLFVRAVQLSLLFPMAARKGGEFDRRIKRTVTRWADNFAIATTNNRWTELAGCARDLIQSPIGKSGE